MHFLMFVPGFSLVKFVYIYKLYINEGRHHIEIKSNEIAKFVSSFL